MALKQVIAVVKPFLAQRVFDCLSVDVLEAAQVREVRGYGRQKSYLDQYGESEFAEVFLPKVHITLWLDESQVEEVVQRIVNVARTGRIGDGKIMILPVNEPNKAAST